MCNAKYAMQRNVGPAIRADQKPFVSKARAFWTQKSKVTNLQVV